MKAIIPPPQVIAIDDDAELLRLIALLLRRVGAQAATFGDGHAALAHLAAHVPRLILLDLMLPEPDGVQILSALRADPRLDAVPILILSAKADARTIQQGLALGADGFIAKPYVARTLLARIRAALAQGRGPRAPARVPAAPPGQSAAPPSPPGPPPPGPTAPAPPPGDD